MTHSRARQIQWIVLAAVVFALGFDGVYTRLPSSELFTSFKALLGAPLNCALIFVAAGFLTRLLRHRIAPALCFAAGSTWAAVWSLRELPRPVDVAGLTPHEVTAAAVACLAGAALIDQTCARKTFGYLASATLFLVAAVGGLASLIALGIDYSRADEQLPALACTVLSIIGFAQLFRHYKDSLDFAIGRLVWPLAVTGSVGAAFAGQLIAHQTTASVAQQLGWMIAASTMLMCLTLTAFAIVRLAAEVAAVRRSTTKWKRLLHRQRRTMHARTTALKRTQAHYKDLFASVPAPVILTHPSGSVLAANPAMLALLGAESEKQLQASNFVAFYADPAERQKLIADWKASDKAIHQGEVKLRRLDGEQRSALFTSHVVRSSKNGDIDYIQGTFTDITELRRSEANERRLEGNLRLSQKLESVGRLAAGIAHEINTPMQYIGDNVYFLRESFETLQGLLAAQRGLMANTAGGDRGGLAEALRELDSAADVDSILASVPSALTRTDDGIKSINRIVAAMKELAHPGDGAKTSTDINAVINTAVTVTRNAHKTVAAVTLDLGDVPNTLAYKNELCQVFINLIVNAAHAIESAQKADRRMGAIAIRTRAAHNAVHIDVSDNGSGIPDSVMDKIFDPFFTTKEVGKGTGQGLALARTTIVEKHGGQLTVQSAVGQGSTFTITLPIGNDDSTANTETS
jgi:PAS domain S-box-containing protein